MSWEDRSGRGRYYTRSRRRGGRVVREYVGTGEMAVLAAHMDAVDRGRRATELAARRRRNAEADVLDAEIAAACDSIELLVHAVLVAAGYHQHDRGQWRKERAKRSDSE